MRPSVISSTERLIFRFPVIELPDSGQYHGSPESVCYRKRFIRGRIVERRMAAPSGLKSTSSPLQISASVKQLVVNTFESTEIPLTLNVLDNEVFVITQVNIDVDAPSWPVAPGAAASVSATLSSTARTTTGNISDSNVIASGERIIISDPITGGVAFDREDPLFAAISEDYLGIVATNNMFLNIDSDAVAVANFKACRVRVYGYRASAGSSVYAALVQSELLSA